MAKSVLPSKVGVLIPAYNESRTIEAVVREAKAIAATVLVVDDGSVDRSAEIAQAAGAEVLRRDQNEGQGKALRNGILALRESGVDHVITIDADAAHDAASAAHLWAAHTRSGADITIGSRFLSSRWLREIPSHKIAANRFAASLLSLLLGVSLTDVACGMRVMGPRALALSLSSTGFGFAFELLWCAVREGLKIHEHPVRVRYDSKEPFWTKQNELIDFLRLCHEAAEPYPSVAPLISRIEEGVLRFEKLSIRLRGDLYDLHGLPSYQAYLVQMQHPWFRSIKVGDEFLTIDFDAIAYPLDLGIRKLRRPPHAPST